MKVLLLHQYFCPDGNRGNSRSFDLAKNIVEKGIEVFVITSRAHFSRIQYPNNFYILSGIHISIIDVNYRHEMPFWKRKVAFICFFLRSIFKIYSLKNIDLVWAISSPITVGLLGLIAKLRFKAKFIFEIWDLWPDTPVQMGLIKNKLFIKLLYCLENKIYKAAFKIIVLSEGMRNELINYKNIDQKLIIVSDNGTDSNIFKPSHDKILAKKNLGFEEDDFLVIYSGTVGLANDLNFLLLIAQKLLNEVKIKFLIVGEGNELNKICNLSKLMKLDNIYFYNQVSKIELAEKFLSASDIGLVLFANFPILATNSATKFYDYIASGLVVGINHKGWQCDFLEKHRIGFGFSFEDSELFSEEIKKYLKTRDVKRYPDLNKMEYLIGLISRNQIIEDVINELF